MGGVGKGIALALTVALSACGGGSLAPPSSATLSPACAINRSFALSASGGTLSVPALCGASAAIVYSSGSRIPASTSIGIGYTSGLSGFPPPVGTNAKIQAAFTINVTQDVDLLSQITITSPPGVTPNGPYGFQLFDGYGTTMYSEEFTGTVNGGGISTPGGAVGLLLSAGQMYILELVQNPDIANFPPP